MISEKTMHVLKNFANINPNIVINEGNVLQTISEGKNIQSRSVVDVDFPHKFGIFDLNEFLAVLNLIETPELKFSEKFVTVTDSVGRTSIKYYYADEEVLTFPKSKIVLPEVEVTFRLEKETFTKIRRAASVLGHNEVSISCIDNQITLTVSDSTDPTSNAYSVAVNGDFKDDTFNFILTIDSLKMVDGNYDVSLSKKFISHFTNVDSEIEYWVALKKTSTYGE